MKISTKGRYGLRILLDIATHQDQGPVNIRDIARRQSISGKYLWQVINPLKGAGLVRSVRGAKGGYMLAREAADISVKDVVSVLEGPVTLVPCVDTPARCKRSDNCVAREAWAEIEGKMVETMVSIRLAELVRRQKELDARVAPSYVI